MRLQTDKDTRIEVSEDSGETWHVLDVAAMAQALALVSGRFLAFLKAGYVVVKGNTEYRIAKRPNNGSDN